MGHVVQLIIYEAKNGNLETVYGLVLGDQGHLVHLCLRYSWNTKGGEVFFNPRFAPGSQGWGQLTTVRLDVTPSSEPFFLLLP